MAAVKAAFKSGFVIAFTLCGVQSAQAGITFDSNWVPTGGTYSCTSTTQYGSFIIGPGGGRNLKIAMPGLPAYTLGLSGSTPQGAYWSGWMNQLLINFTVQTPQYPGMPPVRLTTTYQNTPSSWNCK
jgi:hypothetical protein